VTVALVTAADRAAHRYEALVVAASCVVAAVCAAAIRAYPNYDTYYALVWGRELIDGQLPSFTAFAAPTQHPLFNVLGALAGIVFGGDADRAIVGFCAAAHILLGYGVYRLGSAVANRAVGIIAASLVVSSPMFLDFVSRGYVDIPFLALVVWAGVVAAERPARPALPMSLIGVAGLLRPEAWMLAGFLWLWHASRSRAVRPALLGGALIPPLLWALSDLAVTGDPLFSLHATNALAETLGRPRGISAVLSSFLPSIANLVRPLVLAAGIGGGALMWRWRAHLRSLHVFIVLLASGTATFALAGALGLSVLPRYLTVPAVMVCLVAAFLLAGWTLIPASEGGPPARLVVVGVVAAVVGVSYATVRSERAADVAAEVRYFVAVRDDLHAVLDQPAVAAGRRCGPVSLPTYRQLPDVRWYLDADRNDVVSRADSGEAARARQSGVALVALGRNVRTIGHVNGLPSGTNLPPPGFTEVARNATFAAYVRCP
jgi:hypothetical protein